MEAYVGKTKCCGKIETAVLDNEDKEALTKYIREVIYSDLIVEYVKLKEGHPIQIEKCRCPK